MYRMSSLRAAAAAIAVALSATWFSPAKAVEQGIAIDRVASLQPIWSTALKGATRATPVSDGQSLYIPNSNGYLYRIDRKTGKIVWEIELAKVLDIVGAAGYRALTVTDNAVILGLRNVPVVAAIDKNTGALLWKNKVDDDGGAVITQMPLVAGGRVFIGVSGFNEEVAATHPPYNCCTFRGSEMALDAATGKILWKTHTIPEGFAGGSVWAGVPVMDAKRHSLYVTTGNGFRAPQAVQSCIDKNKDNKAALPGCYPPNVWYDSILALDPDTGAVKWGFRADSYDIFTGACMLPEFGGYCGHGDDFDFGNGALLWHEDGPNGGRDLVGAGEKSGDFWALNPDDGKLVWHRSVGPGGPNGGLEFGSATDGKRVYVAESDAKQVNVAAKPYALPSGQTIKYGSFAALDAATGKIVWQIPDPAGIKSPGNDQTCTVEGPRENCTGAYPKGPVAVSDGVVYACSTAPDGPMYAFDGATGKVLWTFNSKASCDTRAVIIDDTLYWASGRTLYAFRPSSKGGQAKD